MPLESQDLGFLHMNGGRSLSMGLPRTALGFPLMELLEQRQFSHKLLSLPLLSIGACGSRLDRL
ncbi:hypothetical protein SLEP1_g59241 [Rubroshorea leprosula]|uniref:Uncharacterized protein n=1 Tax=Rubroshorea leprosula TaxID=152421 RepID=A0AAV5MSZ9_9ROSI|nr:hypothetical protein SLEP1_g59241 [Rubroshorea leprosula]